jgi:hypothetical protein
MRKSCSSSPIHMVLKIPCPRFKIGVKPTRRRGRLSHDVADKQENASPLATTNWARRSFRWKKLIGWAAVNLVFRMLPLPSPPLSDSSVLIWRMQLSRILEPRCSRRDSDTRKYCSFGQKFSPSSF